MTDQWTPKQRATALRWTGLVLLVTVLGVAFVLLERDRSHKLFSQTYKLGESPSGEVLSAQMRSAEVSGAHWDEFLQHPQLRVLDLSETVTVTDGLSPIESIGTIESVNLSDCKWLDDHQAASLATLPRLEVLNLSGTAITDKTLQLFTTLPLRQVILERCPGVADAGVTALAGLETLDTLALDGTSVTLEGIGHLVHERPDVDLKIDGSVFLKDICENEGHDLRITDSTDIDHLIAYLRLFDPFGKLLATERKLQVDESDQFKRLGLRGPAAGASVHHFLTEFVDLDWLSISDTIVPPSALNHAPDTLTTLWLTDLDQQSDLSSVANVLSLKSVTLQSTAVRAGQLQDWPRLSNLQSLEIGRSEISAEDFHSIGQITSLRSLGLYQVPMTDNAAIHLRNLPQLKRMTLYKTGISPEMAEILKQSYPDRVVAQSD